MGAAAQGSGLGLLGLATPSSLASLGHSFQATELQMEEGGPQTWEELNPRYQALCKCHRAFATPLPTCPAPEHTLNSHDPPHGLLWIALSPSSFRHALGCLAMPVRAVGISPVDCALKRQDESGQRAVRNSPEEGFMQQGHSGSG